jgi:hypothetical protein
MAFPWARLLRRLKMKESEQPVPTTNERKKPYEQPQLQVYGNLRDITETLGVSGAADGGGPVLNKTHL